ncbi:helix-turn-helix domain-containing protein [Leucobacter komagatae]|uniref:helix-turn-helix domain-containing protein n=1 Tax=Leucobacter komagatae TaxID=55969 RepID=UPI0031CE0592
MSGASHSAAPGVRRQRRRPGENRAGLIVAGTIEFGLHGYAGAQTSAIAVRTGVSQPNVYANFSSKRDLFLACVRELDATAGSLPRGAAGGAAGDATGVDVRDPEQFSSDAALLLFQAVAAARDPALSPELGELLSGLRSRLGAKFDGVLSDAAAILLD